MTDEPSEGPRPPPKNNPARAEPQNGDGGSIRRLKMEVSWEGPLPPPATLRALNEVVPGLAERIVAQFEAEGEHRRQIEKRTQTLPFIDQIAARVSGVLFAGGCLVLIGYAVNAGATWAAAILSAAMVVGGINAIMRR